MQTVLFDGQQADEHILYTVAPHPLGKHLAIARIVLLSVFFLLVLILIASVVPQAGATLRGVGIVLTLTILSLGIWWTNVVYSRSRAFITDRRLIRFEVVSPFFQTKRELFWNEALKAKAYAPNLLCRFLKIGTLEVAPIMGEGESVRVTDVYYFEDLANYIDKILFTFKNKPAEINEIKPFIPKPRGQRNP